jgi:hypothetical protein
VTVLRWALGVVVGVVVAFGAALGLDAVFRGASSSVGSFLILVVGSFATGMVAGARTARQWFQAGILTFAAIVTLAVVLLLFVAATDPG